MSTVSFNMNYEEKVAFCSRHKCLERDIGKVVKTSLQGAKHSEYYRQLTESTLEELKEVDVFKVFDTHFKSLQEYIKSLPESDKARLLGLKC